MLDFAFRDSDESISVTLNVEYKNQSLKISSSGNGRLDSVANALREILDFKFDIVDYSEHSLSSGSSSKAISYVDIVSDGKKYFGVGIDTDIIKASVYGLISAINHILKSLKGE